MSSLAAPPAMEPLEAPATWRTVDFISDLHLQAGDAATFAAWQHYMESTPADAVFILGDLFEAWVGDDAAGTDLSLPATSFEGQCARLMGQTAGRLALYFMHGNRDFLVGHRLMNLCNATLLQDPTVLVFPAATQRRWLLSHGDALCVDDTDYLQFRDQVRTPQWQTAFLARPLAERQAIASQLRRQSMEAHAQRRMAGTPEVDVDTPAARQWLQAADSQVLIHGHTHKPAIHDLGQGLARIVLSDWDASAAVPRAEVLRLTTDGLKRVPLL